MPFARSKLYHEDELNLSAAQRKSLVATGLLAGEAHPDGSKSWTGASLQAAFAALRCDGDDDDGDDEPGELSPPAAGGEDDEPEKEGGKRVRRAAKRRTRAAEPDQTADRLTVLGQEVAIKEEMLRSGAGRIEAASRVARRNPRAHKAFLLASNADSAPSVRKAIRQRKGA
jgi:hypothetical protein